MTKIKDNYFQPRDIYLIFSQSFFIPQIQENGFSFTEPFQSYIDKFLNEISKNEKGLGQYLSRSKTPFWDKNIFIPNIGELTYNHKKNNTSRLLIGPWDSDIDDLDNGYREEYVYGNFTFKSSKHFNSIPHLPFLIEYNKKIQATPNISQFLKDRRSNRSNGKIDNSKLIFASQNNRIKIHFYPYGLFVINLAISITSTGLNTDELIDWIRQIKNIKNKPDNQVFFQIRDLFKGNLTQLFQYLWHNIYCSVVASNLNILKSPIYDSIRIKPISRIDEKLLNFSNVETLKVKDNWKYLDLIKTNWPSYVSLFIKSHEKELTIQDYQHLGITPGYSRFKTESNPLKDYEWAFSMAFHDMRRSLDYSDYFVGNLEEMYLQYLSIGIFLKSRKEYRCDFFLSYIHKKLKDSVMREIRQQFPIILNQNEIAGILSKNQNWKKFNVELKEYKSVFGRYIGDTIIPKSKSLLIIDNNWSTRKQLPLLFQWQLQAVHEIVSAQRLIVPYYIDILKSNLKQNSNSSSDLEHNKGDNEVLQKKTLSFLTGLTYLHTHLPPHFRKWYHELAQVTGVQKMLVDFKEILDKYLKNKVKINQNQYNIEYVVNLQQAIIDCIQIGDNNFISHNIKGVTFMDKNDNEKKSI